MPWFKRARSASLADRLPLELRERLVDLEIYARQLVRGGYVDRGQAIDLVEDYAEVELGSPQAIDAEALVDREIATLQREQRHWEAVTSHDRLRAVMEGLEMSGIVAREDFCCCAECGNAEIGGELERAGKAGIPPLGYAFFHQQDTEAAVEGEGLYFSYGAAQWDATEREHIAIGRKVVKALEAAGFSPSWNGRLDRRIHLPMTWQRRWGL